MLSLKLSALRVTLLTLTALSVACSVFPTRTGIEVETWYLDGEKAELVRKQEGERRPVREAHGYFCVSPEDEAEILKAATRP